MSSYEELHYPNLVSCKVKLQGAAASSRPPVRLPPECTNGAGSDPSSQDSPYDFSLERNVVKKLKEREADRVFVKANSRDELEKATLVKMKSVTGAKDEICVAMLESNGYDLKTSIEAYYMR
mmetsp:Transcript_133710/g.387108  ORF Transcript_133710/g.387108 Transcript_133710/m.387108 type:complete len:122 (+) Transcript_133710:171-536(+)|eukprot:CAMPEP_0176011742 /NCGR_PEP_ID=MMETSP0120_2-20121206/5438_1 /TAXON_ID=160619 /ORGANISM="Kryptoperidinium foliaceum, Strain CCMP 1326" /LENGTH=121 /DNA_ID=CAMNT_0017344609 /DNA_START=167 /DNA_END=532 /DNA_ORIENTATION=+